MLGLPDAVWASLSAVTTLGLFFFTGYYSLISRMDKGEARSSEAREHLYCTLNETRVEITELIDTRMGRCVQDSVCEARMQALEARLELAKELIRSRREGSRCDHQS